MCLANRLGVATLAPRAQRGKLHAGDPAQIDFNFNGRQIGYFLPQPIQPFLRRAMCAGSSVVTAGAWRERRSHTEQNRKAMLIPIPIPAICENNACGAVFFLPVVGAIGSHGIANLQNMRTGPCPKCGSSGRIPDGQYTPTHGTLSRAGFEKLLAALVSLEARARGGASSDEISEEISAQYPFLESLKRFLPTTAADLCAYLALAVATLTFLTNCAAKPAQQTIVNVFVKSELAEVITRVGDKPSTAAPKDHSNSRARPATHRRKK